MVEPFVSGKSAGHDCPAPPCPDGFWLSYASYASENMLSWTFLDFQTLKSAKVFGAEELDPRSFLGKVCKVNL